MQQFINHLKFFFFIAIHFNPVLALCMLYDEMRGEAKYKINTTAIVETRKLKIKGVDTSNANEYMPSNYVLLERVFNELNNYNHNKTFLDFGCGKGRTLIVAAHFGFQQIIGVDFVEAHCRDAKNEIEKTRLHLKAASFHIACADAATYRIPDEVQTLFFYNPFNEGVMNNVIQHIMESLVRKKRRLFVIYLSAIYRQHFINAGFKEIYRTKRFGYLKASILSVDENH